MPLATVRTRPIQALSISRQHQLRTGVTLALVATVFWASTSAIVDALLSTYRVTPVNLSFWRTLLVSLVLAVAMVLRQPGSFRISSREIIAYLGIGVLGLAGLNVLWSASVGYNKAAVGAVLVFSAPVFVAIGSRLLFKERITRLQVVATVLNLAGCGLVAGISGSHALGGNPLGLAVGLASGLCFAVYTLLGTWGTPRTQGSSLTVLFYSFLFAAVGLLVLGLILEGPSLVAPALDGRGWALLVSLALGPTLLGYGLYTFSLRYLPSTLATLLSTIEAPLAAVIALIFLHRAMSPVQWFGTAIIVGTVVAMQRTASGRAAVVDGAA